MCERRFTVLGLYVPTIRRLCHKSTMLALQPWSTETPALPSIDTPRLGLDVN